MPTLGNVGSLQDVGYRKTRLFGMNKSLYKKEVDRHVLWAYGNRQSGSKLFLTAGMKNVSPDAMVPSVRVLAFNVCFRVAEEVKTLLTFLRCFPHVETLHVMVESMMMSSVEEDPSEASDDLGSKFWEQVGRIECVASRVTKVLLDGFSWGVNEVGFLELVLGRAEMLESAVLLLNSGMTSKEVTQATRKLARLKASAKFASDKCQLMMFAPPIGCWSYDRACDLSLGDPFPSRHVRYGKLLH